ncbi:SRPBCC family protein [Polaromonas sp. YR568]|uniref:SRPBCC family protein n=1 Tax=Polaromonas sp. YR568 TaxID=1855301 RepID=UPI00398BD399
MPSTAATVTTSIEAPAEKAFLHIVPIALASIFTGYGPLPSVTGTLDETGPWDAAGRSRTVVFSDGSSARETLVSYEYPSRFAYRITGFTGVLRFLASEAHGEWWFESVPGRSATSVRWRYEFISRSGILKPLVGLFTRTLWRGYMGKALRLARAQVEARV